jgi:hypothetical protein
MNEVNELPPARDWQPTQEWSEPEEYSIRITRNLSYFLSADEDDFDVEEALAFLHDMKIELAIYYARIEGLQKLEKKCKEAIRATGEVPDVENVVVKFGKPRKQIYAYTKKLVECAAKENVGETIERLGELHDQLTPEGQEVLMEIRQEFARRYMPLSDFFYEKDVSASIKIEV